jgi:uncharacterized membrane protein
MRKSVNYIAQAAIIAALYVVLVLALQPLAFGVGQIRVAEALTILPMFTSAAIPGLGLGCLIANILGGAHIIDIIFGSLTTLVAAFMSYKLMKNRWLVPIPPVVLNALVIPIFLKYLYGAPDMYPFMVLLVGAGQFVACYILGNLLITALNPVSKTLFRTKI